jgi:dTDP-4-dehydrorhamnose 3,5-epimerase
MHYQRAPFGECKTVRCTEGSIFDVIIDIRPLSHTYKQWIGVELTARNFRMLHIPEGFAHGYITLEDNTSVHYSVSQYYSPGAEAGIPYNDPCFNIQWPGKIAIVSERDRKHPFFEQLNVSTLTYAQP